MNVTEKLLVCDVDGDHCCDMEELAILFDDSSDSAESFLIDFDENCDGYIDLEELTEALIDELCDISETGACEDTFGDDDIDDYLAMCDQSPSEVLDTLEVLYAYEADGDACWSWYELRDFFEEELAITFQFVN